MTGPARPNVVPWSVAEPARARRDRADVESAFPDLRWVHGSPEGGWTGRLPLWPFDRPEPPGLRALADDGLVVDVDYPAAYPMVAVRVWPRDPEPSIHERTQHRWHVNGDGSLCLLQSDGIWDPRASVTELLLKAAGWRVEYALLKAGLTESMTESGVVSDSSRDHLLAAGTG